MQIIVTDDYQMMVMAVNAPKSAADGSLEFSEPASLQIVARKHYEAIDQNGNVRGVGLNFSAFVGAGDKIKLRLVAAPRTEFTAAEINAARKNTRVCVVDHEQYNKGEFCFDGTLDEVAASLTAIRESIPAEFRDAATCCVDSNGGYEGSHYAHIEVSYWRPETDSGVTERLQRDQTALYLREREERAKLAALKAKYAEA